MTDGTGTEDKENEGEGREDRHRAHACLRRETRASHAALDARLRTPALTSREGYVRYLRMNQACLSIEPALVAAGIHAVLPDWDQRQRGPALARDMEDMGIVPLAPPLPRIESGTGALLGWSYVLEGSRLGAAVILAALEAEGVPGPRDATRFLRHGLGVPFWRSFKTALSRIDHDEIAITHARAAARTAFGCFLACAQEAEAAASG